MKKSSKMNFKEWRGFVNNIVAGIFGGFIVLFWSMAYEIVKNKSFLWKTIAPTILIMILFVFMILFLRFWLLNKKEK